MGVMLAAATLIAAATLGVLAVGGGSTASAAKPCWRLVLDDWTDNMRLDKSYSVACYNQALENIPEDIRDYTDAYDKIANARQAALRGEDDRQLNVSGGSTGGSDDDPGGGSDGGAFNDVLGFGSDSADSVPLPLAILAALAGLLMAAGAAGLLARKLQARRTGPPGPPN